MKYERRNLMKRVDFPLYYITVLFNKVLLYIIFFLLNVDGYIGITFEIFDCSLFSNDEKAGRLPFK